MSVAACAEIVRAGDPDRFLAVMAAPVEVRARLFPIFALNVGVARAPWVTEEAMIAEMRLQWWRDVLAEIQAGGPARRHEVATPLAEILNAEGAAVLDRGAAARRWDIYRDPFEDEAHFERYLDETAGGLLWVAVRALGSGEEAAIRDVGFAQGLANWFRAIPALEARGRLPLVDGREDAIRALAEQGLQRLARGRAERVSPAAVPALRSAWLAGPVLKKARARPDLVGSGGLEPSEFRRRGGLLWRSALGRW